MKTKRYLYSLAAFILVFFIALVFDFKSILFHTNLSVVTNQQNDNILSKLDTGKTPEDDDAIDSGQLPAEGIDIASTGKTVIAFDSVEQDHIVSDTLGADDPDIAKGKINASGISDPGTLVTKEKEEGAFALGSVNASASMASHDIITENNDLTESNSLTKSNDLKDSNDEKSASASSTLDTVSIETGNAPLDSLDAHSPEADVSAATTPKTSVYSNIGISIANSYVNIRKEPSTDSSILGKLYRNAACKILDTLDGWYYVESGSVTGYVSSEYIKTGIPDDILIRDYGALKACVIADGLNVREKPIIKSDRKTVIYRNEVYPVISMENGWVKLDIEDDNVIGFVAQEYVEIIVEFPKAISREEELELQRLQEEQRIKKETEIKYRDGINYTAEDLKLLACLVHAEAGNQSYEGKLAVANIVLNRVRSSKFPNTIKEVVYQAGQFSVASSGSLEKQLSNYKNYRSNSQLLSIKAAKAALEGANNIGNRLYFHSYKTAVKKGYDSKPNCVKLDDHLFW